MHSCPAISESKAFFLFLYYTIEVKTFALHEKAARHLESRRLPPESKGRKCSRYFLQIADHSVGTNSSTKKLLKSFKNLGWKIAEIKYLVTTKAHFDDFQDAQFKNCCDFQNMKILL